jgi:hypothetical protein
MPAVITLPPGTYWIGDLMYVLDSMEVSTSALYKYTGLIRFKSHPHIELVTFSTGGDGKFKDQEGREYPVDSASIGMIKAELIAPEELEYVKSNDGGHLHVFTEAVECSQDKEELKFGNVTIFIG